MAEEINFVVATCWSVQIYKDVIRFDISMSNSKFMQMSQTLEKLVAKLFDLSIPNFDLFIVCVHTLGIRI